jgi:hypothetical protein
VIVEIIAVNASHEYAVQFAGGARRWFLGDHLALAVPEKLIRFFRAEVLDRWKQLDDDAVASLNGDFEELITFLQDRYDFSRRRAQAEVNEFFDAFKTRLQRATETSEPHNRVAAA